MTALSSRFFRLAFLALTLVAALPQALAFSLDDVGARASSLASRPYKPPVVDMPTQLRELDYDAYRDIRFRPEKALWRAEKLPFELMFFHQGRAVPEPVRINVIEPAGERPVPFDPALFDYGKNKLDPQTLSHLGFNGLRVHFAVNKPGYKDEVVVFQGASYFRALVKGQSYGLSARGLAVDTATAEGEEFPRFVEFWIEKPRPNAPSLTIFAMLDSRRITGAYRFVLTPGTETVMQVTARLYAREKIAKLGLAPLTSMFTFGENQPGRDDYRPEVHDSDGLSIQLGNGEWVWRPLVNPRRLLVTSFATVNPLGFGIQQRDRDWASYQDLEARYDLRPSGWIEPKGKWGAGRVELVQIPTPDETNDNVVAYWVPDTVPPPKAPLDFEYRLLWQRETEVRPPLAWVAQTRRGHGYMRKADDTISYVIDFEGPALKKLPADAPVEVVLTIDSNAELVESNTYRNDVTAGWRATLRIRRVDEKKPVEMRAFLRYNNSTLSETWSYVLPPV